MRFLLAFAALYIGSFVVAIVWNIVLFKSRYEAVLGDMLRPEPIFSIGLVAVFLNCAAIVLALRLNYPVGRFAPLNGVGIVALMWMPHYVNTLATTAKLVVPNMARYIALETAFAVVNVVVLGLVVSFVLGRGERAVAAT